MLTWCRASASMGKIPLTMSDCRACHKTMKTIENIAFNRLLILMERK